MSFGRDTICLYLLLPGVYAMGSKTSNAEKWKKPIMDSLTLEKKNFRINHSYASPRQSSFELNIFKAVGPQVFIFCWSGNVRNCQKLLSDIRNYQELSVYNLSYGSFMYDTANYMAYK